MAVPKNRLSQTRQNRRRANWKLTAPGYVECPQCHEAMMPPYALLAAFIRANRLSITQQLNKKQEGVPDKAHFFCQCGSFFLCWFGPPAYVII